MRRQALEGFHSELDRTIKASHVSAVLSSFLPRFICLRRNHFKASLDHLHNCLELAGKQQGNLPSIKKRVLLGFLIGFIWFAAEYGIVISHVSGISENNERTLNVILLIIRCMSYGHQIFTYVSLYAIVLLIAQRITMIQEQFQKTFPRTESELHLSETAKFQKLFVARTRSLYRNKDGRTSDINLIRILVDRVHWAGEELVRTYSPILLLMLIMKLITIVTVLIRVAGWLVHVLHSTNKTFVSTGIAYLMLQLLIDVTLLLIVFHMADIPVQKMSKLRRTIADYDALNLTLDEKTDLNMLFQRISVERVQLSAGGLFAIGKHLLPTITGTVITYIVILVQAGGASWKDS